MRNISPALLQSPFRRFGQCFRVLYFRQYIQDVVGQRFTFNHRDINKFIEAANFCRVLRFPFKANLKGF